MTPTRLHALFGGAVQVAHFGTAAGNFSPRQPDWAARHRAAAESLGLARQVRLRVNFSADLAGLDQVRTVDGPIVETVAVAEGLHLTAPGVGAAITSADCCTGVLWNGTDAVVMHLGLACVHRPHGGPTVLEAAANRLGGDLQLWLGGAAGPCCYGWPTADADARQRLATLTDRFGPTAQPGPVRHGPRRGFAAIDHVAVAAAHAEALGIAVQIEPECTACAGLSAPDRPGYGAFYSNVRDAFGRYERNLVVAWRVAR